MQPGSPSDSGQGYLLVVTASPSTRDLVKVELHAIDVAVEFAAAGYEALEHILTRKCAPLLLVLDLALPYLDGAGLAHELRAAYGTSLPILALGSTDRDHSTLVARDIDAQALVAWPTEAAMLAARARRLLTATPATGHDERSHGVSDVLRQGLRSDAELLANRSWRRLQEAHARLERWQRLRRSAPSRQPES